MIVAFGVVLLGFIGAIGASLAAPLAALIGGIAGLRGARGLAAGLLAWAALSSAAVLVLFFGLTGDAGRGVKIHGWELEELLVPAPWCWLTAAILALGFFIAGRRGAARRPPHPGHGRTPGR